MGYQGRVPSEPKHISFGSDMLDTGPPSLLRATQGLDSAQVLQRPVGSHQCILILLQKVPCYRAGSVEHCHFNVCLVALNFRPGSSGGVALI